MVGRKIVNHEYNVVAIYQTIKTLKRQNFYDKSTAIVVVQEV